MILRVIHCGENLIQPRRLKVVERKMSNISNSVEIQQNLQSIDVLGIVCFLTDPKPVLQVLPVGQRKVQ